MNEIKAVGVVVEHFDGRIRPVSYEAAACALKLARLAGSPVMAVVPGDDPKDLARVFAKASGFKTLALKGGGLDNWRAGSWRAIKEALFDTHQIGGLVAANTVRASECVHYLAALCESRAVAGVEAIEEAEDGLRLRRSVFGSKLIELLSGPRTAGGGCATHAVVDEDDTTGGGSATHAAAGEHDIDEDACTKRSKAGEDNAAGEQTLAQAPDKDETSGEHTFDRERRVWHSRPRLCRTRSAAGEHDIDEDACTKRSKAGEDNAAGEQTLAQAPDKDETSGEHTFDRERRVWHSRPRLCRTRSATGEDNIDEDACTKRSKAGEDNAAGEQTLAQAPDKDETSGEHTFDRERRVWHSRPRLCRTRSAAGEHDIDEDACTKRSKAGEDNAAGEQTLAQAPDKDETSGEHTFDRERRVWHSRPRLCRTRSAAGENPYFILTQPGAFAASELMPEKPGEVIEMNVGAGPPGVRLLKKESGAAGDAALARADVIVAAGRGIGKKENLVLIQKLAAKFSGSAVGASRPICDAGWLPYNRQVGQTGATVTPKLYIACGISGSTQHVAGMRGSEFVVAVNTDPDAAIFKHADVGVIEDFKVLISALDEI